MAASDYVPVNLAFMANPMNWLVVIAMVLFAGLAIAFILPGTIEETKE